MARKSLRPHLNQIRSWVRQGRTDAWVAHQLEVPVQDITQFKEQNELVIEEELGAGGGAEFPEEVDLRAEDDALIAAELEAAALEAEREKELAKEEKAKAAAAKRAKTAAEKKAKAAKEEEEEGEEADEDEESGERGRRRGRRGGRRRKAGKAGTPLEGTFDHGEEGYGLWLDPAIQDDPVYAEHWAGHRPVEITIEEEQIVIRRIREDS